MKFCECVLCRQIAFDAHFGQFLVHVPVQLHDVPASFPVLVLVPWTSPPSCPNPTRELVDLLEHPVHKHFNYNW